MSFFTNLTNLVDRFSKQNKTSTTTSKKQRASIADLMDELGVRTSSTIGTYQQEENPDSITIDKYIAMKNTDGTVKAIVRLFTMPIQASPIKIMPAEKDNGERDFIETVFLKPEAQGGMSTPLPFIIADMTRAIVEGFRLYEKVPQIIQYGEYSGMIGWKKLAPRDSTTITLRSDEKGGFLGAHQTAVFGSKLVNVDIPPEKCILYTFQKEEHPFYGESILKTAYYHYDKKHKLYYLAHKKAEVDAVGLKILKLGKPLSDAEVNKAEEAVDEIGMNSRVTLPPGFELEIDRSPTGYDVMKLIDHHDTQIALSTLTQALQIGSRSTYNYPYGKGYSVQTAFIDAMLSAITKSMEDTLNEWAVAPLIDWNFGSKNYPRIKLMPLKDEVKEAIMSIFSDLIKKDPTTVLTPSFASKITNEVAEILGIEEKIDVSKEALTAFETGKKQAYNSKGKPAKSTPEEVKNKIKNKAIQLKDDPQFLEKFTSMGKTFAFEQMKEKV